MHMRLTINEPAGPTSLDWLLQILRFLGLIGLLGGLGSLTAMWAFGPRPTSAEGWTLLIGLMRAIFFPTVFAGLVTLTAAGSAMWWRRRQELHATRWFRVMITLLAIAVPTLHLWARSTALRFYATADAAAGDAERLAEVAAMWDQMGIAYAVSLAVLLAIAFIGIIKPRLGAAVTEPRADANS